MISARGSGSFVAVIACLWLLGLTAIAQQASPAFTGIVVFGDSLSDTGNVRARTNSKTGGAIDYPSHTFNYDNGRFTNDNATDPASHPYFRVRPEQHTP